VVANRRQERVLRLGDDPTQQIVLSIYSVLERWRLIWTNCAGSREGNESRRRSTVPIAGRLNYGGHWMVTTAHTDAINFLRRDVLTMNGKHAGDCRTATSPVCTDEPSSTQYIPAHPRPDLSPRDRYQRLIQRESRRYHESAHVVAGGEVSKLAIQSGYCTIAKLH
jgi:hypothetical protein